MSTRSGKYVAVATAVVVIVGLGGAAWWWTHPTLLSEASMVQTAVSHPRSVDDGPFHIGVAGTPWMEPDGSPAPEETVTFRGATAHFRANGAGVRVRFAICEAKLEDSALGIVDGDELATHCTSIRPLRAGTRMRFGSPEYVVATVTPTTAGTTKLDHVTLDYSRTGGHLGQRGKDRVHGDITLRLTP